LLPLTNSNLCPICKQDVASVELDKHIKKHAFDSGNGLVEVFEMKKSSKE